MDSKLNILNKIALWISILGICACFLEFGFTLSESERWFIDVGYIVVITIGLLSTFIRYKKNPQLAKRKVILFDITSVVYTLYILYLYISSSVDSVGLVISVILSFIIWGIKQNV